VATTHEIDIEPGRTVAIREMTVEELANAVQRVGEKNVAWHLPMEGLRSSLVQDGGTRLTYQDLLGGKLGDRFTAKQLLVMRALWEQVNLPSAEDLAVVHAARVVVS
jgi:hypothetical protein